MKTTYSFQRLTKYEKGIIKGAMSPFLAAQETGKQFGEPVIAVFRINFKKMENKIPYHYETIYQLPDGGTSKRNPDITHHDMLLTCFPQWCVFQVDGGYHQYAISCVVGDKPEDVEHKMNNHSDGWIDKLTDEELTEMMLAGYSEFQKYVVELKEQIKKEKEESNENIL